ncbi:MAG: response regulator [Fidelibacterota bacterium]
MSSIKITIVDDHELFREGLALVLRSIDGFEVAAIYSNGQTFIDHLEQGTGKETVLMDIRMPQLDGIQATGQALKINPELRIIALTVLSDRYHYQQILAAGAAGFMLKSADKSELKTAISRVHQGGNYFSSEILSRFSVKAEETNLLSPRETQIVFHICRGLSTKEIADHLNISIKTIETHRASIFKKTRVRNAPQLVVWAVKNKILQIQ